MERQPRRYKFENRPDDDLTRGREQSATGDQCRVTFVWLVTNKRANLASVVNLNWRAGYEQADPP